MKIYKSKFLLWIKTRFYVMKLILENRHMNPKDLKKFIARARGNMYYVTPHGNYIKIFKGRWI